MRRALSPGGGGAAVPSRAGAVSPYSGMAAGAYPQAGLQGPYPLPVPQWQATGGFPPAPPQALVPWAAPVQRRQAAPWWALLFSGLGLGSALALLGSLLMRWLRRSSGQALPGAA
eukprot:gb/GFBE01033255.1/.p1 GENE.gb/GFBE01033255.1/~~gb/GFBE01033255.1/.p1  ORF type:complete len:115 (+),score=7.89 gb/GFBE01033255.1/:1-345(+)